jgi:proteasome lid subunit RPN8/RPN11
MRILEGKLRAELLRISQLRAPLEAAGLILSDDRVVELPNHAGLEGQFAIYRADIVKLLENEFDSSDIVIWHSHPGGGIGPSRTDMKNKTLFPYHLVLALHQGDFIESWY